MERIVSALNRAVNSDAVVNTFLVGIFGTLAARSMVQQHTIEALEAEKDAMVKANKAINKTIWTWKQQLYAEADRQNALVPLATLKSIYGEVAAPTSPALSGEDVKQDGKPPVSNFMI